MTTYRTCSIRRTRRGREEIQLLREFIYNICEECRAYGISVRGLFYQLVDRGLVEKTEKACRQDVSRLCGLMREEGVLPWSWIADHTRWMRKPDTYDSIEEFQRETAALYRRELWRSQGKYIEVWCEKATLAGVITAVTAKWDVPLMCTGGFSSKGFIHSAAAHIVERGHPSFIYYLGDHDPSGLKIWQAIQNSFRRYYADIFSRSGKPAESFSPPVFEKLAVTQEQIKRYSLPTRPTKTKGTHARTWKGGDSVELDAMPTAVLCALVEKAIVQHVDQAALAVVKVAEESEREMLSMWKPKKPKGSR